MLPSGQLKGFILPQDIDAEFQTGYYTTLKDLLDIFTVQKNL